MSWTYSGDPAGSPLDAVRFEIQDTDTQAQLLQDAEIEYAIAKEAGAEPSEGGILCSAARCMEVLSRLFAAQADTEEGSLKVTYSKQAITYSARAVELRQRATGLNAPWTGGTTKDERRRRENETGVIQPLFRREQFNIPWAGSQSQPFPPNSVTEEES